MDGLMNKLIKLLVCIGVISALTGCAIFTVFTMLPGAYLLFPASYYLVYEIEGNNVDNIYTSINPVTSLSENYSHNEDLVFSWRLTNLSISFNIENNTNQPIKILWAESTISIDKLPPESLIANNNSHTDGHKHSLDMPKFPQELSILSPSIQSTYRLFPYSHSEFRYFTNSSRGHWGVTKVLWDERPDKEQTSQERQSTADNAIGRNVRIFLPIILNGEKETFVFDLTVTKVTVKRINW